MYIDNSTWKNWFCVFDGGRWANTMQKWTFLVLNNLNSLYYGRENKVFDGWKKRETGRERERFLEILLLSGCNISSLFAFHSGHCQGRVRFYTQAFRCGVFLKKKKKNCMQMCVFCRFGVLRAGGRLSPLVPLTLRFSVQLCRHVLLSLPLYHMWFDRENSCLPSKYLMLWLLDYSEIYASVFLISEPRLWAFFFWCLVHFGYKDVL